MDGDALAIYCGHTGRTSLPSTPAREAWPVVGRRGGKSRIAALVAVYLACFHDYGDKLAPGEVGTLPVIAADRKQARIVFDYVAAFLEIPLLKQLVVSELHESIELTNQVSIEIHTSNFKSVRGQKKWDLRSVVTSPRCSGFPSACSDAMTSHERFIPCHRARATRRDAAGAGPVDHPAPGRPRHPRR